MNDYCQDCGKRLSLKMMNITQKMFGRTMCKSCELDWKASQPDKWPAKLVEFERQEYEKWKKAL